MVDRFQSSPKKRPKAVEVVFSPSSSKIIVKFKNKDTRKNSILLRRFSYDPICYTGFVRVIIQYLLKYSVDFIRLK